MRIVFINYHTYMFSSGVHIHFIANELTRMGHECTAVVPRVDNTDTFGRPEYAFSSYEEFADDIAAGRYGPDTILHAWTPRENVRQITRAAAKALGVPYFVHMEDNERRILEAYFQMDFPSLVREAAAGRLGDICSLRLSHPILHQTFLAEAAGVSVLMDRLAEFVPENVPSRLIWPACEREFFRLPQEPNLRLRRRLGIPDTAAVIVYPGNVHIANADLVAPLYRALPLVAAAGRDVRLVRCAGSGDMALSPEVLSILRKHVLYLKDPRSSRLVDWIGMADLLVQPGSPNTFDDYRFPSKLPLFLASGRPVVLARTNLGRFLTDAENSLILEENTPEAIAEKILWLLDHPAEARAIGHNGRKFAAQNFNWTKTAKTLLELYSDHGPGQKG